jgi:hypothetical protein
MNNSSPLTLKSTSATVGIHTDLPVSDVDKKCAAKPLLKGDSKSNSPWPWGERWRKVSLISDTDDELVTAISCHELLHQSVLPWLSATSQNEIKFFCSWKLAWSLTG